MRRALCIAAAAFLAGCLPRGEGLRSSRLRGALPPRSVSVTIYSAPPREEEALPGGYYRYEDDWDERERIYERERRRVATQMRIFAEQSADDPDVLPYGIGVVKY